MSCTTTLRQNWGGAKIKVKEPFDLHDLVEDYLKKEYHNKYSDRKESHQQGHISYLETLSDTIDFICGEPNDGRKEPPFKVNGHQRFFRFPSRQLRISEVEERLSSIKNKRFDSFEDLYSEIRRIHPYGFGDTTVYDFSLRYGYHLKPKVEPKEFVYVHSKPAETLKYLWEHGYLENVKDIDHIIKADHKLSLDLFPDEIRNSAMTAADVEHFLCCYQKLLMKLPNKK